MIIVKNTYDKASAKRIPSLPKNIKNNRPNTSVRPFCKSICVEYDENNFLPKSSPIAKVLITYPHSKKTISNR